MRNCLIHFLVVIFGSGSWLAINGIFSELSFLVQRAPESWNLASGLVLTIQLGNIIPFAYVLLGKIVTYKHTENPVIYSILAVGCISSILLGFFWSETIEIWGERRSLYLYIFTFSLAAVDCFSSITYFPFMARFPEKFVVSLMIGEGLSGFAPSVLALAQNGGTVRVSNDESAAINSNSGNNFQVTTMASTSTANSNDTSSWCQTKANFPEEVYFFLIFVLFLCSGIAYSVLNKYMCSQKNLPNPPSLRTADGSVDAEYQYGTISGQAERKEFLDPSSRPEDVSSNTSENRSNSGSEAESLTFPTLPNSNAELHGKAFSITKVSQYDVILFTCLFLVCFLFNGALPSVSTYILLPYGNEYMLIVSNIANIANPLTCTLMIFIPFVTNINISTSSTIISSAISVVLLVFAAVSPPWTDDDGINGKLLTGLLWVLFKVISTVARVVQANICRSRGATYLFLYGVVTQIGSFCGALLFYYLCNHTSIFVPAYADC